MLLSTCPATLLQAAGRWSTSAMWQLHTRVSWITAGGTPITPIWEYQVEYPGAPILGWGESTSTSSQLCAPRIGIEPLNDRTRSSTPLLSRLWDPLAVVTTLLEISVTAVSSQRERNKEKWERRDRAHLV